MPIVIEYLSFQDDKFVFYFLVFKAEEDADRKKVYDTANFYHFVHTLALLGVPLTKRPVLVSSTNDNIMQSSMKPMFDWILRFYLFFSLFTEWHIDYNWNYHILWNYLLPCINEREAAEKIHTVWRNRANDGLA